MMYTINRGNVPGYSAGQSELVYLRSSVETVLKYRLPFVFTDGHPIEAMSDMYDDVTSLNEVDWSVMVLKYWKNTTDDPDRKRRRQAEFLVKDFMPLELVEEVGCIDHSAATQAIAHLPSARSRCSIRRDWYY